jgi:hypothetical protein
MLIYFFFDTSFCLDGGGGDVQREPLDLEASPRQGFKDAGAAGLQEGSPPFRLSSTKSVKHSLLTWPAERLATNKNWNKTKKKKTCEPTREKNEASFVGFPLEGYLTKYVVLQVGRMKDIKIESAKVRLHATRRTGKKKRKKKKKKT